MKFWGVELKAGESLKEKLGYEAYDMMFHLSQASLVKRKKKKKKRKNVFVPLFLKIGDQKLVLGTLSPENHPRISFDLVFEKDFELYHNWKNGSVYFCGCILGSSAKPNKDDESIIESFLLPQEIIIEIMSWLPVESLLRFKCVCKEWYSLIEDRYFITKHLNRASLTPCFCNAREVGTFTVLSSLAGLLLEKSNASQKYRIRNPATRQTLDLPDPHMDSAAMVISFVPSTGDFKLISIYDDKEEPGSEGYEILTVRSNDLSWRPLKIPKSYELNKNRTRLLSIVKTDGAIHCVLEMNVGSKLVREVKSLDLESECFTSTTLPQGFFSDLTKVWALDWKGDLSFANIVEEEFNVLVLEDYKNGKWGERKIVVPLRFMKENQDMKVNLVPDSAPYDKLWFLWKKKVYFAYHTKLGKITETMAAQEGDRISGTIRPSLVAFKAIQPAKRRLQINL